jgi:hypothetical protein
VADGLSWAIRPVPADNGKYGRRDCPRTRGTYRATTLPADAEDVKNTRNSYEGRVSMATPPSVAIGYEARSVTGRARDRVPG